MKINEKPINVKNDINWLYKRFKEARVSKYGSFKVKEVDFNALLRVGEYIDMVHAEKVAKNTLFAKLYIYFLNNLIDIYETDVLEETPQKELSKLLDIPLETYFSRFHQKIHVNWKIKMCEKLLKGGVITDDEKESYIRDKYSLEYVEEQLTYMINQALNRFE